MTINQLKYFVTAANCLNFTEAGKIHFISQTAITQHIQSLEEQLGVKLFIREKRKVFLTPAGKVFLEEARAILERTRIAVEKTEKAASGATGTLNIGYVKGFENSEFGTGIRKFHDTHPNIEFYLYRSAHLDLMMQMDKNEIDIAFTIVFPGAKIPGYTSRRIGIQRLYAVLYPSHPFANQKSIKRSDLKNERFVLTKFYDNKIAEDYHTPKQFVESGYLPNTIATSSDPETLQLLVSTGMGISIMPEHAVKYVRQSDDLVFLPMEGENEYLDVVAFWKEENENPALKQFIHLMEEDTSLQPYTSLGFLSQ
jgi:DNA-binding transcriptional LysR family regulator